MRALSLSLILIPALYTDFSEEKIPNQLILFGWLAGILYQLFFFNLNGLLHGILGAVIPIIVLFLFFVLKMLGAGDIKLLSVIGMFYGFPCMIRVFILVFLIGGLIAFILLVHRNILIKRFRYLLGYIFVFSHIDHRYYIKERDGKQPIMHFSLAISGGVCLWEIFGSAFWMGI